VIRGARYVHTNLVASDWRALARFYEEVFGCVAVPPERDYAGAALEAGSGVPGARLRGQHLRLPGCGENGPTLEVFQYEPARARTPTAVNRAGFGHIAFQVDSVAEARALVLARGGQAVGETVSLDLGDDSRVTWCYVTDPEGNVVELQSWSRV
jgi:predicted enzyme related to lactoylglutathione lyase